MDTKDVIEKLRKSELLGECPSCGDSFKFSEALLFDGTKPFPNEAVEIQKQMLAEIDQRKMDLAKRMKLATQRAENTAKAVNIGKKIEVIFPTLKNFKWALPDCRFLGEPIDMITFNGCANNKIDSMSFIEIKSGGARLNTHQKAVRDAINDKKVSFRMVK